MRITLQKYRTGELLVVESPVPQIKDGTVRVRTLASVISAGTEKTKVDTARKSLVGKAMARPDLVRQVIRKAKKEGLWKTWQTVTERLDTPIAMGYSSAGEVVDVRGEVGGLQLGDLVSCAGSTANHSEIVTIPRNLVCAVPHGVSPDHAAFATLGAIALQGVRQADVRIGERIALVGLGLIGLLTSQILAASGCRVLGIDLDPRKLELAKALGCHETCLATDPAIEEKAALFGNGHGVDTTIITAASPSNQPIELAAEITRERGRVVVVGLTKMDVPREPFYMKEIELKLSRSYGPGRYDKTYEEHGQDYPYAYVRFTEQRNMACFLELVQDGKVRLDPIITHRFSLDEVTKAYGLLHGETREPYLGIVLQYRRELPEIVRQISLKPLAASGERIQLGLIGAGKYATANLLPALARHSRIQLGSICTGSGSSAPHVAEKFGFAQVESDADVVIRQSSALIVATRHDDHASYVLKAIQAGKPVFVEKPLVLTEPELAELEAALEKLDKANIMVGFNRRFAPGTAALRSFFGQPDCIRQVVLRINAGPLPSDHWLHDPKVGGGRLIGEGCHFVDLAVALTGSLIQSVAATGSPRPGVPAAATEDFSIVMGHQNGAVSTIIYTSTGDPGLAKERIETHGDSKSAILDDFQSVETWSRGKKERTSWSTQNKGQSAQIDAWVEGLSTGRSPIAVRELLNVHLACLAAIRSLETGGAIRL